MQSSLDMPHGQVKGSDEELPMYIPRPNSVKSQDVTHILAQTFRQLFTRDIIAPDTVEFLNASRGGDDEFHEAYVNALQKIKEEHDQRLAEAAMLERHILQAQARALTADEKEANCISGSITGYPDVCIPPARSHFRSCIDSELLRKHNLICPDDFSALKLPVVPAPRGDSVPHYSLDTCPNRRAKKKKAEQLPEDQLSENTLSHLSSGSEIEFGVKEGNCENISPKRLEKNLWKQQISNEERLICRAELGSLQDRVNHLKNQRFFPPGDLLVRKKQKKRKEIGIKLTSESSHKDLPVFIANPAVVTFTDYKIGRMYELKLELKNVTTVIRPVRVIPPKTSYFSVGLGQFPGNNGLVAPGMSCVYAVRFSPESLSDYDDVLTVEMQSPISPLIVPLQGRRPVPILTVPEVLNVGHCLVGGVKVGQFILKNEGGSGRFCIMPSSSWPSGNFKVNSSASFVQIEPFEIKPSTFELNSGELTTLEVLFAPTVLDVFTQSIIIVCNNCHVRRLTVLGEAKEPHVELVSVEDYLSEYEVGEMSDVTAQHLIRFPTLVPFIFLQETFTVKNCINVEMAYSWVIVRPHHIVKIAAEDSESESSALVPHERVEDVESVFCVDPQSGVLPSGGTTTFTLTFAPPMADQYKSVLHLVLRYFLQSPSAENLDLKANERWATKSVMPSYMEPMLTEMTALEIEVKGICEPYQVFVEPCVINIPGQILVETTFKKSFKMSNKSFASVMFSWSNIQTSSYLLQVEPSFGEIMPQTELLLELSITGSEPGKIDHRLLCDLSPVDEPLTLQVLADIKGPELVVDSPDVNFGLVQLGLVAQSAITVKNFSRVPAKWRIVEVGNWPGELNEFEFSPEFGEIKPLGTGIIGITFKPKACRLVHTIFEISLSDGFRSTIPVYAEVQSPSVHLQECQLNISDAFQGVPVLRQVVLVNQTLFRTPFQWGQVQGMQLDEFDLKIEPDSGILEPRQKLNVMVSFTSNKLGEYCGLLLPCMVEGMAGPLCLEVSTVVCGLSVSYGVSESEGDGRNRQYTDPVVDLGSDNKLGDTPKRFLFIKNNSGIQASFQVDCEHYKTMVQALKPPTPPEKKPPEIQATKSQRKLLLVKTPNLADPVPKTKEQLHADLCKSMLQSGRGAAFHIRPCYGILEPFAEIAVEVTGFSDMWGTYTDRLICQVDSLELVYIPVTMTVFGCPLYFTMVNPKIDQKPIMRFGTHVAGASPIVRPARIMNTSPVDLRLDWQTFNVLPNDNQLLDLIITYGDAFPLKEGSENEVADAAQSSGLCLETSEEETTLDNEERPESCEAEKPKVITLTLRNCEGKESPKPFEIRPLQLVVPAFGSRTIDVVFTPEKTETSGDTFQDVSCVSYALGYISLDDKCRFGVNVLSRLHQYDVAPLRIDMTAAIDLGLLSVQYANDEDGLQYHLAASDLLTEENKLKPQFMKISSMTLCNRTGAILEFHLESPPPFAIVELDTKTKEPIKQVNRTELISLRPLQHALVYVAFRLTPELVEYVNMQSFFSCGRTLDGNEFQESNAERKLKFQRDIAVEFKHRNVQKIPMLATLVLPSIELSTESVDFGICFVGQTREIQITIANRTTSNSWWSCSEEQSPRNNFAGVFKIAPNSGKLDAQLTIDSTSKAVLSLYFTAKEAKSYETVYIFEGLLGEQLRRLSVKGQGSHDGHFEALVNI